MVMRHCKMFDASTGSKYVFDPLSHMLSLRPCLLNTNTKLLLHTRKPAYK
jgi:hypothetical protein